MTPGAAAAGTYGLGDRTVNRLGFGAMRLTANADGSPSERRRAVAVLGRAVELGVNHIDTASVPTTRPSDRPRPAPSWRRFSSP
jgi:aryl-alcohol dehydrogenase-like predicted oxidoreductase